MKLKDLAISMNRLQFFGLMLAPLFRPWRVFTRNYATGGTSLVGESSLTLTDIEDLRAGLGKYDGNPIVVSESGVMSIHPSVTSLDDFHKAVDIINKIRPDGIWVPIGVEKCGTIDGNTHENQETKP